MFIFVCVCKYSKFECLTDTPVSLPISSPAGSGSVVSEPLIPLLNTMPLSAVLGMTLSSGLPVTVLGTSSLSGPPFPVLGMMLSSGSPVPVLGTSPSSGPPVPVLGTMPSSGNPAGPVPGTSGPLTNSPFYEYVTTGMYLLL